MLQQLRSTTGSWIAKGILGLLVLSFLGWGIADYTNVSTRSTTAAEVGDIEIGYTEFANTYQTFLRRQGLSAVDADVARQLRLADSVLKNMTTRALYEAEAKSQNLTASDAMVRQEIETRPEFQNATGQFDRLRFENVLIQSGLSEGAMVEMLRRDSARAQLIDAVTAGSAAPSAMVDLLFRHFGERRSAAYVSFPLDSVDVHGEPDDAALQAFFDERKEDFRRPELRSLTYVLISPEALAEEIAVDDADIAASYEARHDEFVQPETRDLAQILFPTEEAAREAAETLKGVGMDELPGKIEALGLKLIDLGTFERDTVPNEGLADASFAIDAPGATDAFQGAFGWSVAVVKSITPGNEPTLDDVRDTIRDDLALDRAYDEVFKRGNHLEDAFGQGQTLEEAAATADLPVAKVDAVDAQGRGPDGSPVDDLPAGLTFLRTAFDLNDGEVSFLETTESNAMFMVRVDAITPAAIPELADVRQSVVDAWKEDRREAAAENKAKTLVGRLEADADIETLAAALGLDHGTVDSFARTGQSTQGAGLPETLARELFGKKEGEAAYAQDGDRFFVARVTGIKPADAAAEPAFRDNLADTVAVGMSQDLNEELGKALAGKYPITTNPAVYEQVYQ
ncbi:hypothetical protein HH303_05955 [Rhodospirillaceae bacterium KN72]|uniref:PpiC domain-containing protein n=1 Tax=Pacificispira spongiicola TaxID=2729598 RepID=A0A7Y0E031_9PROT|nr:peptidylprolyl isomerase [Pacificispira spongiicola]NMM44011.1 hypothetical protein [Pacificispira spongiicola]